jgi:hypothetical protein
MAILSSSAPDRITKLDPPSKLLKSISRKLLLGVALISTVGWVYLLLKAVIFIGAKYFS